MFTFVESPSFSAMLPELWTDAEYAAFQQFLAANPRMGDVIPGLGWLAESALVRPRKRKTRRSTCDLPAALAARHYLPFLRLYEGRNGRSRPRAEKAPARGHQGSQSAIPTMKKKAIAFNAEDLVRSVEEVRDALT